MNRYQALFGCASLLVGGLSVTGCVEDELDVSSDDLEIIGGTFDNDYKYPWAVDVTVNPGPNQTRCSGVLVHPMWVLASVNCTGAWSPMTISYRRTNANGISASETLPVPLSGRTYNGGLILLPMEVWFDDPLRLLSPAALPTDPGVVGQIGTVVSGHHTGPNVRTSTPSPTIQSATSSTFTVRSTGSSLCATDRGAGFIAQSGGRNVVLGVATSTGTCSASGETWTATQIAPYSQWIHDVTGMWGTFNRSASQPEAKPVSGDFDGDGDADIALAGMSNTVPVAFSNRDGTFAIATRFVHDFPNLTDDFGAKVAAGDVNGDGRDDLILTGIPGMTTIRVAFSEGDGRFTVTNHITPHIPGWAVDPSVKVMMGDVDNDGDDDIILTGGTGWYTIPVGFSNRDGTFTVTNQEVTAFPGLAQAAGAKPAVSDVNGDGKADLVLVGGSGWTTVPTALSVGNGSFTFSNPSEPSIGAWSPSSTVKLLGGCRRSVAHASRPNGHRCDVNDDGRSDILLTGGAQWSSIPVGYRRTDGTMWNTNAVVWAFPTWAQDPTAKAVSGDFNGDRRTDLVLVGGASWWTVPIAYTNPQSPGAFTVSNKLVD